jgi:hypothetical protein
MPRRTPSGPTKLLRDDVDPLQQREPRRDVGDRPLYQLTLLEPLEELIHSDEFLVEAAHLVSNR